MTVFNDMCLAMIIVAGFLLLTACAAHTRQTDPPAQAAGSGSLTMMSTGAGIGLVKLGGMAF